MTLTLKSIEEEAAACREAFKGFPVGRYVLHCHHDQPVEVLWEDAEHRVTYILTQKPENERALRLRLFRPVSEKELKADAEWKKVVAELQKADAEWKKADAAWKKAIVEWKKADAERKKADAAWKKADAAWKKASVEWKKADAALGVLIHAHFCVPDCPWNGKTIFPLRGTWEK